MPGGRPSKITTSVTLPPMEGIGPEDFAVLLDQGIHPVTAAAALGANESTWRGWCAEDPALAALAQQQIDWWFAFWTEHQFQRGRDRAWRIAVFERDGYRCQRCPASRDLHAHHREPWAERPDLRLDIDNGETLCVDCHADEHPEYAPLIRSAGSRRRE